MISDLDTVAGTDLVLPLSWHDLGVCSRNVDTSEETSFVVCVSDSATERYVCSDGTVVRSLSTWVAVVGPTKGLFGELG